MIYEVRNYHFKPERFEEYKVWAKEKALPYLDRELDLIGFWASTSDETSVTGAAMDSLGSANITWIIRWPDKKSRDEQWDGIFGSPEWSAIFKDVPGGLASYLRMESKFTEALL